MAIRIKRFFSDLLAMLRTIIYNSNCLKAIIYYIIIYNIVTCSKTSLFVILSSYFSRFASKRNPRTGSVDIVSDSELRD